LEVARGIDGLIAETLMRPTIVVEVHERLHDVIGVPQAKAREVIQALASYCGDP